MIEILSGKSSHKAIVTLAIGDTYETNWRKNAYPSLIEYCKRHNLGLYLQNTSLDTQTLRKKITWQKLLLAQEIKNNFSYINEFCYIDSDVIANKFEESIFSSYDGKLALVSQFKNLPFNLNLVLRRIAFYRNWYFSSRYPLDSSLFMGVEEIYKYHNLTPQSDYACAGLFMGDVDQHSKPMKEIFESYDSTVYSITDGGDEPILNFEFQSRFAINWLPYKFQALWLYEMAAYFSFLYEPTTESDMILKCVESSLRNNIFLHFAGSWNESDMISASEKVPGNRKLSEEFNEYCKKPITGIPIGRILPGK